jgi:hypothetical protein
MSDVRRLFRLNLNHPTNPFCLVIVIGRRRQRNEEGLFLLCSKQHVADRSAFRAYDSFITHHWYWSFGCCGCHVGSIAAG